MNSTPHPRPGNADIPIGGFFFPRPIPISSFCPLCLPATPTSSPTLRPHKSFRCNTYGSPVTVANKRLTAWLSPLYATLTKTPHDAPSTPTPPAHLPALANQPS